MCSSGSSPQTCSSGSSPQMCSSGSSPQMCSSGSSPVLRVHAFVTILVQFYGALLASIRNYKFNEHAVESLALSCRISSYLRWSAVCRLYYHSTSESIAVCEGFYIKQFCFYIGFTYSISFLTILNKWNKNYIIIAYCLKLLILWRHWILLLGIFKNIIFSWITLVP